MDNKVEIKSRRVKDYLNSEIKDAAKYIIETRALPNIMDGLRVGARKILFAAVTGDLSKKKLLKMPTFIGDAMRFHYNHGDVALMNTIVQLGSKHVYKYTPLEIVGQIPTLRIPKSSTAPRYLHIRQSPYLDMFKKDLELTEQIFDEGEYIEPKYFLPIVPISLLWRTNSPGFGFSYRSFSYTIDSVIDNCIKAIGNKSLEINEIPLIPAIVGIKPENIIYNGNKDSWYIVGEYNINLDTDVMIITDLPYDISFEKYEEHLQNLIDKGYINSYKDAGLDGGIRYMVQFPKGRLRLLYNEKWKFYQTMKLYSKVKKNTLNVLDEDGTTMLFFDSPYELIQAFVKRRLKFYDKRKTKTIKMLKEKIQSLNEKIKFVQLIITDKLIINKRKISDIKKDLDIHNIPHDVLKMNIDKLTIDEIQSMEDTITDLENQLKYILETSIQEMYLNDLIDLKKQLSNIKKL